MTVLPVDTSSNGPLIEINGAMLYLCMIRGICIEALLLAENISIIHCHVESPYSNTQRGSFTIAIPSCLAPHALCVLDTFCAGSTRDPDLGYNI